jgi:hypothetical protein
MADFDKPTERRKLVLMSVTKPLDDNAAEQSPGSLRETLDQAELARVRAESQALATLARVLEQATCEANDASDGVEK